MLVKDRNKVCVVDLGKVKWTLSEMSMHHRQCHATWHVLAMLQRGLLSFDSKAKLLFKSQWVSFKNK